jgi:lipid-A-disaccharide synthase-like uncharacterized protein
MINPYTGNFMLISCMTVILMVSVLFLIDCWLYMQSTPRKRPPLEAWLTGLIGASFLGVGSIPFIAFFNTGVIAQLMGIFCLTASVLLAALTLLRFADAFPLLEGRVLGMKWMTLSYAAVMMTMAWISTITESVC